jgi:hypothetical protein
MHLPFSKALLWLFLEGRSYPQIKEHLDELSLPPLDDHELDTFSEYVKNTPVSPGMRRRLAKKLFDRHDHQVAEKLGLSEIYCKHTGHFELYPRVQIHWEDVSRILRNPVARVATDVAILCGYKSEEIAQILPGTFYEHLSAEALDLYCKYFFDHSVMTKSDWRAYLQLCAKVPYAYIRYHAALTKPRDEALYLSGLPTRANFSDFLRTVMGTAAYKFQYYSRLNSPQTDGQARAWAKIGFDAGVRFEKFTANDVQDFAKTVQTEFDYTESAIETIDPALLTQIKPPEDRPLDTDAHPKAKPPGPLFTHDPEV